MSPVSIVAATAFTSVKTTFTTPPTIFRAVQRSTPRNPPLVHVCGGLLYWTITLTLVDGFDNSGRRSGEIFEVSANTEVVVRRTSQRAANRAICFARFRKKLCIMAQHNATSVPFV